MIIKELCIAHVGLSAGIRGSQVPLCVVFEAGEADWGLPLLSIALCPTTFQVEFSQRHGLVEAGSSGILLWE